MSGTGCPAAAARSSACRHDGADKVHHLFFFRGGRDGAGGADGLEGGLPPDPIEREVDTGCPTERQQYQQSADSQPSGRSFRRWNFPRKRPEFICPVTRRPPHRAPSSVTPSVQEPGRPRTRQFGQVWNRRPIYTLMRRHSPCLERRTERGTASRDRPVSPSRHLTPGRRPVRSRKRQTPGEGSTCEFSVMEEWAARRPFPATPGVGQRHGDEQAG